MQCTRRLILEDSTTPSSPPAAGITAAGPTAKTIAPFFIASASLATLSKAVLTSSPSCAQGIAAGYRTSSGSRRGRCLPIGLARAERCGTGRGRSRNAGVPGARRHTDTAGSAHSLQFNRIHHEGPRRTATKRPRKFMKSVVLNARPDPDFKYRSNRIAV
jgi:hypothetical protein